MSLEYHIASLRDLMMIWAFILFGQNEGEV